MKVDIWIKFWLFLWQLSHKSGTSCYGDEWEECPVILVCKEIPFIRLFMSQWCEAWRKIEVWRFCVNTSQVVTSRTRLLLYPDLTENIETSDSLRIITQQIVVIGWVWQEQNENATSYILATLCMWIMPYWLVISLSFKARYAFHECNIMNFHRPM